MEFPAPGPGVWLRATIGVKRIATKGLIQRAVPGVGVLAGNP